MGTMFEVGFCGFVKPRTPKRTRSYCWNTSQKPTAFNSAVQPADQVPLRVECRTRQGGFEGNCKYPLIGAKRFRDLLLFVVGINTALRISDLLQLRIGQF